MSEQNETLRNIAQRHSCKAFADELPEREKLEAIAKAGLASPSATNSQPWRVVMVTDRALLQEIEDETVKRMAELPEYAKFYELVQSTGMKLFYNAPCMAVLPIDASNPYAPYDCGILSQTICLAAESLGVASHIVAINSIAFDGEKGAALKERLGFPEGYEFGLAVLLGTEAAEGAPHELDEAKVSFIE